MLNVFVYGTLKPGESYYQSYCKDKITGATSAYTAGQLFHLPVGYPAMIPGNSKVKGFLLTFAEDSILEKLDELEGYHPQRSPEENEYERHKILVRDLSGQPLGKAWSYLMSFKQVQRLGGVLLPSGWWTLKL
jgi:gamma-glutamylcyclotransferase (GGCT)/AIG2-like uncharacterized protein YtfP